MGESAVRLTSVSIRNFKNVKAGNLSFLNTRKGYKASILGLYGQNGSGKTALIDVLDLLKYAMSGMPVPDVFADYIHVDSDMAEMEYEFEIKDEESVSRLKYQFCIGVKEDYPAASSVENDFQNQSRICIFNEVLKCPIISDKKIRISTLIDTTDSDTFTPASKRALLAGNDKNAAASLLVARKLSEETSRSFIFSREFLEVLGENEKNLNETDYEFSYYHGLIKRLAYYARFELFIINTRNSGLIRLNALPLSFRYEYGHKLAQGTIPLPLDTPTVIPENAKNLVDRMIANMNIVLQEIIPHLTVSVRNLGTQVMENGETGIRIQLMSEKNEKAIPLKYESDGIKKIISILQLLIVVYNRSSMTVAIDKLDAGVFEYLLGELLRIISEKGKGQLIFTSHNLRILETIDRGFTAFTTVNPDHRYIRLANVKEQNNLRDIYYRGIMLGEQSDELYELTNNSEIALAFMEAGVTDAE